MAALDATSVIGYHICLCEYELIALARAFAADYHHALASCAVLDGESAGGKEDDVCS